MRFEVLGPLIAYRDEGVVPLGSVQQRVVLAVLLLHANRSLGREQLVDAVWGTAAPTYAVNLVQKHVSGLRRALEPDRSAGSASRVLVWTGRGYLLNVPDGGLDLGRFDRELVRARTARAAGDLPAALAALRTAERLWRGQPFEGLTSPLLDEQREWLTERWISAVEERIEIDLTPHHEPNHVASLDHVAELRRLVSEHPLRERLRGLLMQALYQADRQGEALATYHEARAHLLAELGIEPAAPLQTLQRQILANDPALDGPRRTDPPPVAAEAPPGPPSPVEPAAPPAPAAPSEPAAPPPKATPPEPGYPAPAQLPHSLLYFTGRDVELARLDALVADGGSHRPQQTVPIATITGPAGVGKTTLAVQWAHQVSDRFPDGQLYVNLRGFAPGDSRLEPSDAIRGFLEAFEVPSERIPSGLDARAALYRSVLAGRRVLVVLDNARDAEHVRPLLPGGPGCLAVVTSRDQLTSLVATDGAHPVVVGLLDPAQARQLLARRLRPERVADEPGAVDDIIASCAGLPLALAIVAARAAFRSGFDLSVLAEELRLARGSLDAFDGDDSAANARAAFSWSYRQLSAEAARLFRVLGLHPGPDLAIPAAASLVGVRPAKVRPALAELVRAHLISEPRPGRLALHDLLRVYAGEQTHELDDESDRRSALRRLLEHYLHTAYAATWILDPHRFAIDLDPAPEDVARVRLDGPADALAWFANEHAALQAALQQGEQGGAEFDRYLWRLAWALVTFEHRRGLWQESAATQLAGLRAAERLGDPTAQAIACRNLARAYAQLVRYDEAEAHLNRAMSMFGAIGHRIGLADTRLTLARVAYRQGRHQEALGHAQEALQLYSSEENSAGQASSLNAIGWFHVLLGKPEEALDFCEHSLLLHRKLGDQHGEASTSDSLGFVYHHLGRYPEAIVHYEHAIKLWQDLDDRYNEADTLTHLGDTHQAGGDRDEARDAWQRAMELLDDIGHADIESVRARLDDRARSVR
jgi:DNA-binding SARP family transcriptional activator/tetratricopeptide (TPR) repeat protein